MHPYPSPFPSYTKNPEEVLKELSKKWSDSQSQANSQFTFRPPYDLYRGPELQEIRIESNTTTHPLKFFSAVDGYSTQLDSPKASIKFQETIKFTNDFSNGIVNRTLKAVEDAQVTSEGRNMQIELELSGLKLFDLEKKVDSCLSSSRTVLSLNSRLSPNVSTVLSHSAAKDKLARLQQDYTSVTRGYSSISPSKSTSQNIKISTSMMDSMNLQELTVCMSPMEREKILTMDKKLNETKNNSLMISPVALAAKKYLENKENPYNLSTPTKPSLSPETKTGGIATVKKPGALGRPVESQSSPIQRSTSPIEFIDYNSAPNPRDTQGRENRIMSVSTGYEEKSADTIIQSHPGVVHNRWMSSANESRHKNEEESGSRVFNGEVSFRDDKVDKILFKDHFVVSPVLKSLNSDDSALTKENMLLEKPKSTSQPSSEVHLPESKTEKPKAQLPPLKTWTLGALETQNTDASVPTGGRVAPRDMKGDISSETDKIHSHGGTISNDSDKKMLESLSEAWKGGHRKEETSQEKKKYTDKPRPNIRYDRPVAGGQLTRQNKSYENLHKSAKKNSEENNQRGYRMDSGEEYMLKSEKDDSSIRIESEPSYMLDNSVEKEIHNFLSRFDSEKARGQAREWLKKVIDGDKNSHTKSLEVLQREYRRRTTGSSNTNSYQSVHSNSAQKKPEIQRASSSSKIQKGPIQTGLQKEILGKTTPTGKDMYNLKKKDVVVYSLQKGKTSGPGIKDSGKKECKSHSVISESPSLEEKPKASSMNGFTRKKLDSSSTSVVSQDEAQKIKDRKAKTESLRNMAKNLEYLEYLRKDVVRSINYIEKSIQDLGDNNDTSIDGKAK